MSSLRAVISAATRSSKSFCVLSSPITRSGSVYAWRKSNLTHEANFSSTNSCLSSDKDIKAEQAASSNKDVEVASDIREISSVQNNQTESVRTESFEEIISASRRIFSPSFGRDCQYRLVLWQKKLREAEKEGKQVDLDKVLSDSFSDVVEFSLTPLALPEVRLSVLKILLTQESDNRYSKQVLQSTTEDVMQLPMGIVAEIVRLISLAPPTKLRVESRRALVSAIVNRRWYEVGAKHLVFFMFQMDELYDVKTISKQLRLKSKAKEQISAPESKRNGKSNSDSKTKALNPESIVEETVANAFNDNGKTKEETGSAEEQGRQGKEEEGTANTHASIASLNMESRAITLANELKVKDLARVVSLLSRWNSRNEPLLNACLHRLSLADLSLFSAVQLSNLLQAMASLSLHHSALLENSTHQLASKLSGSAPSPPQVCTILQALSLLRWAGPGVIGDGKDEGSSKNLVKCCLSYLCGQQDKLTTKEAASVLTSLANLSAIPSSDAEKALVSGLAALVLEGKSPWWSQIHCVWCMSVLRALDSGMLSKVLSPEFVGPVVQRIKESASPASVSVSANKLAQINMAARLDLKGYDGPVLSEEQLGLCTQMTRLTSDQRAAKTLCGPLMWI
ncbi:hypothetical protein EGW08_020294 [Elysia chlorotica]|uniref:Uncharacterized protein n=1 Tax=Elysia chlorotica TaxID=188477 RepID=A0A433SRQ5_ELYCH|nr:hypothetical protein EGW08_020294 [Elysia chlorotica]